jgi:kumamolisin
MIHCQKQIGPEALHDTARPGSLRLLGALAAAALAGGCGGGDESPAVHDGLPRPMAGVYTDFGSAPGDAPLRGLIGFALRDQAELEGTIARLYDPGDPLFRRYLTAEEWIERYAPTEQTVSEVQSWLVGHGLEVRRVSRSRLVLEFAGKVEQYNSAFETELRTFERKNHTGGPTIDTFGLSRGDALRVPEPMRKLIRAVVTTDGPPEPGPLPGEGGEIVTDPPPDEGPQRTLAEIAGAYGLNELYDEGYRGRGVTLGVMAGAGFKFKDLHSFWGSMGVPRAAPRVVETMDPLATRYRETTANTAWSAGLAPEADVIVYTGPDARNTSLLYTFTEAIALAEATVFTNSFAHREDAEAPALREQYHYASMMAASLGMTVLVAAGNSAETDTPSSCPYVTAVGGTALTLDEAGRVTREVAWERSGAGPSLSFAMPAWQKEVVRDQEARRAVCDLALTATVEAPYLVYYLGQWVELGGTSLATPAFAGMMAVVNSYRLAKGLPPAGLLNPVLYTNPAVQATFRDIVEGETPFYKAGEGWDYPTGWGAPNAAALARALP